MFEEAQSCRRETVTRIGAQQGRAGAALVEELTGIYRHGLQFGEAAMRRVFVLLAPF